MSYSSYNIAFDSFRRRSAHRLDGSPHASMACPEAPRPRRADGRSSALPMAGCRLNVFRSAHRLRSPQRLDEQYACMNAHLLRTAPRLAADELLLIRKLEHAQLRAMLCAQRGMPYTSIVTSNMLHLIGRHRCHQMQLSAA